MKRNFTRLLPLLALLLLASCSRYYAVTEKQGSKYEISREMPQDSSVLALYRPYKLHLDSTMNAVVAVSAIEIEKARPEGRLNNLVADAMFAVARQQGVQFDVAYTNYGGLRIPLPKGDIPLYKVYELMPFENALVTLSFSGAEMQEFFDYIAGVGGDPIAGATLTIRNKKAHNIRINGQPLDPAKTYTVLTTDYMANGGDGGVIFSKGQNRMDLPYKLRDAIVEYLKQQSKAGIILNPKIDGRITVE